MLIADQHLRGYFDCNLRVLDTCDTTLELPFTVSWQGKCLDGLVSDIVLSPFKIKKSHFIIMMVHFSVSYNKCAAVVSTFFL